MTALAVELLVAPPIGFAGKEALLTTNEKTQTLLRNLLKRAGYATLRIRPTSGENRLSGTELIDRVRSGMISPGEYPSSAQSAGIAPEAAADEPPDGIRDTSVDGHSLRENQTYDTATEFSNNSNGDRWFLCQQADGDQCIVLHRANAASGGHETRATVAAFLEIRPRGPEHYALAALLADK